MLFLATPAFEENPELPSQYIGKRINWQWKTTLSLLLASKEPTTKSTASSTIYLASAAKMLERRNPNYSRDVNDETTTTTTNNVESFNQTIVLRPQLDLNSLINGKIRSSSLCEENDDPLEEEIDDIDHIDDGHHDEEEEKVTDDKFSLFFKILVMVVLGPGDEHFVGLDCTFSFVSIFFYGRIERNVWEVPIKWVEHRIRPW